MSITLYKRGCKVFNNNGEGILKDAFDQSVKDTINDLHTFDFKYPVTGKMFNRIEVGDIVRVNASPLLPNQRFVIQTIKQHDGGYITVHALHKAIVDMATDYLKEPVQSEVSQSCIYALNQVFNKSFKCRDYVAKSDVTQGNTFNISRRSVMTALMGKEGSILDTFGNGVEFEYDNSTADIVRILKRRGRDTNVLISYGKNISGYECEMDEQELYTVIIPIATDRDDNTKIIYGDPYYAPNYTQFDGELYIKEQDLTDRFGESEEMSIANLAKYAEKYMIESECNIPKFTYKIDFETLENKYIGEYSLDELYRVNIGDTVTVHHRVYNVNTKARISSIEYDPVTNKITKLIVGDVRPVFSTVNTPGKDGANGQDGSNGQNGQDGKTLYTWIRYANDELGNGISPYPEGKEYIGIAYNKESKTPSDDPKAYQWSKYIGADGIPGEPGADGKTLYTWIKYASDDNGTGMSDDPTNKGYMGIAINQESPVESLDPKLYTWSKIKGEDASSETMPDTLPDVPKLTGHVYGATTVELSWTFDSKFYYTYEVYVNTVKGFTPTVFDRIYEGQASTLTYSATPPTTLYFKCRAKNSHGRTTALSNEVEISVKRIEDMTNYFSEMAIGKAVVSSLTADYMESGIIKANWVEFKGMNVIDGNQNTTLGIDSFGRVTMKPSVFKLLINGEEHDVATEAQLIATREDFQFKFNRSGSENILRNSWFDARDLHWIPESWDCGDTSSNPNYNVSVVQGGDSQQPNWVPKGQNVLRVLNFGVHPNPNRHWCGAYQIVKVEPGQTYTLSFYCAQHRVSSVIVEAKKSDGSGGAFASKEIKGSDIRGSKESNPSFEDDFSLITFTFRVPSDTYAIRLLIWSAGKSEGSASNLWVARTQLEVGYEPTSRRKNSYEVYSNTTTIDGDGITIKHDNGSQSKFNHEAIEFLNSQGRRTLKVKDGGLNFHTFTQDNEMVGFVKSCYSGSSTYNGVTLATYQLGDYVSMGISDSPDENGWDSTPFITCTAHGNIPTFDKGRGTYIGNAPINMVHYLRAYNGLDIMGGEITLKSNGNVPNAITRASSDLSTMMIGGDNSLSLGIRYGDTFKWGIKFDEADYQANKTYINSYGDWDFHNYSMYNVKNINTLMARTMSLRSFAKALNFSYTPMTLTDGELRYVCRETQHITNKTLIVELPQIFAENIELDYHVNISKLSWGDYRIIDRNPYYFEIETNVDDFAFTYEVVAKSIEQPDANVSIASMGIEGSFGVTGEAPVSPVDGLTFRVDK